MKMQLSAVLFSLCVAACGGPREQATDFTQYLPKVPATVTEPEAGVPDQATTQVATKVEDPKPIPTKFEDALAEGRKLADAGDRSGAKEMFEAAVKLDKRRAEPHMELARIYLAQGDKAMAVLEGNRSVKLAPNSSQAWNTKGRAELARFAYDDAIEAFTKSVELNKDNVWAWNNLGYTELLLKKYDDAVTHLGEATSKKGATGYMWNNLGVALEQMDRLDEARHAFEEGGKLGSKEAVASRSRLEGVKSIAIVKLEKEDKADDGKAGYDINEGQTDEDDKMTGSASGSGSGSDTEEPVTATH